MPKNSKSLMIREKWTEYHCPCGYNYTSNDMKGHTIIVRLHKKVCNIAKECKIVETLWKRTTDDESGTFKQTIVKSEESNRF